MEGLGRPSTSEPCCPCRASAASRRGARPIPWLPHPVTPAIQNVIRISRRSRDSRSESSRAPAPPRPFACTGTRARPLPSSPKQRTPASPPGHPALARRRCLLDPRSSPSRPASRIARTRACKHRRTRPRKLRPARPSARSCGESRLRRASERDLVRHRSCPKPADAVTSGSEHARAARTDFGPLRQE